jgi:hypothetical protein
MTSIDTQTRRLTINAAFLKDIKDDSRDLKILFDRIQPLLHHPRTAVNHWPEIIQLCADVRDQLALHFSLEEAYGYFNDALDTAPRLSTQAETLRGQHTGLFQRIRDLADRAMEISLDSEPQVARFLTTFAGFQQDFQLHEEAELKLILDAMDDDIGVGD